MKEIILVKNGELTLKGLNRFTFEDALVTNIKRHLKKFGDIKIQKAQSTMYIEPLSDDFPFEEALERVGTIFGIAAYSRCCVVEKDFDKIIQKSSFYKANKYKS